MHVLHPVANLVVYSTECTSTVMFTVFTTNCCPHILIMYRKCHVHADEELKANKEMEELNKLDREMRTGHHWCKPTDDSFLQENWKTRSGEVLRPVFHRV